MSINKPTKPTEQIADSFGGVKENFADSLIASGYEDSQYQILGGANLNYMLDSLGKNIKYNNTISDYIVGTPVAKTITVDSNNKLGYTQYGVKVYDVSETYALGDWVIGNVDNAGRKIYESLSNGNVGNALTNETYWKEVNLGKLMSVCFRKVGEIIFSLTPLNDTSLGLLNGQVIASADIPEDFGEYITWLRTNASQCFLSENEWQTQSLTYGECGKFVYDADTGSVRLPKITGLVQGTNTSSDLGKIVEAGLPSITHTHTKGTMDISGTFSGVGQYYSNASHTNGATLTGAFYRVNTENNPSQGVKLENNSVAQKDDYFGFNASRSWTGETSNNSSVDSVYGNSNTVQPQTIKGYYYIVLTNQGSREEIEELLGLTNVYKFKGTVNTYADLPTTDLKVGDVYNVKSNGKNYVWVGISTVFIDGWDDLGGLMDMSNYYTKSEVYNKTEVDTMLLEIESGDVDVTNQISSVVDEKLVFSTGLSTSDTLKTNVSVTSSNSNLTVTSSYTGTQSSEGRISYVFTYDGSDWLDENSNVISLATYDLTITSGTPQADDIITLVYNTFTKTTITTVFDGDYDSLSNKPTIPTVPTNVSAFTNDAGYLTSHQDISGKEDVNKAMNTLATSGTIALTDNSVNKITPSGNVTFTLPTVTDLTVFHQILVQINLSTVYTFDLGLGATPHYFNKIAPDLSNAGVYNLVFEYDNANAYWVAGVIEKGASS